MFAKRAADFVLKSSVRAGLVTCVFSFFSLFAFISYMVVGLVTLRQGPKAGFLVLMWAFVPLVAAAVSQHGVHAGFIWVVASYTSLWLMALILRQHGSWSLVLELAAALGVLFVLILHSFIPDQLHAFWMGMFQEGQIFFKESGASSLLAMNDASSVARVIPYLTGISIALLTLSGFVHLLMSRYWQSLVFNPGGLKQELKTCRLGTIMVLCFVVCVSLVLFRVEWAMDIAPILAMIFFLLGILIIHQVLSVSQGARVQLILFYGLLVLFGLYLAPLLILVAVLDRWVNVRKWLIKSKEVA